MSKIEYIDEAKLVELFPNGSNKNPDIVIVDIRNPGEYAAEYIDGSINIPLDELNQESKKLDKSKTIILCCASGTRSGMAVGILKRNGFHKVMNAGTWGNTLF